MKIIDERKEQQNTFGKIKVGECFLDDDNDLLMKIKVTGEYNTVLLSKGRLLFYFSDAPVIPVNTTLTITD